MSIENAVGWFTSIEVPGEVEVGQTIRVTIGQHFDNPGAYTWSGCLMCEYNGVIKILDTHNIIGAVHNHTGTYNVAPMPNEDVRIKFRLFAHDDWGHNWKTTEFEGTAEVKVLARSYYRYISPVAPPPEWVKLATKNVTLTPEVVAWQKLATRAVTITPIVVWQKLASRTIEITPTPVGWQGPLATKTIEITPEEAIPPEFELIQETIYPYAYIYDGDAETCVYSLRFLPEQLTPPAWLGEPIAKAVADKIEEQGERVLELRVYADTSPIFWTDYRVEVTSTVPAGGTLGIAFPWAVVIVGIIVILGIVVLTWAIVKIYELIFKPKPLTEEIKEAWSRGTLIGAINDFELKLERAPTPPEELEAKSDQELRDYCDELAREIVPPAEVSPLAMLVLIGGLGVLGVGAAVALTAAKPPEELEE